MNQEVAARKLAARAKRSAYGLSRKAISKILHCETWKESAMRTLAEAITQFDVQVHAHLDRESLIPILAGLQRQGDIIVIPDASASIAATTTVPREGVAVVRGEAGGNTHLLLADGPVRYDAAPVDLTLGVLTVEPGATAYLAHPEHGYAGIAPGTYVIRRQREQADEIRMVAD